MQSHATTVAEYLAELPEDRRKALDAVRKVIRKYKDKRIAEGMQYGMIGYFVPLSVYPPGYHCKHGEPLPYLALASQKNHLALYLMCLYSDDVGEAWFRKAWAKSGKKLDMGKCCLRFKKLEDLELDVIAELLTRTTVEKHIDAYERALRRPSTGLTKRRKPAKKR